MNIKVIIFGITCAVFTSVSNAASYNYDFTTYSFGTHVTALPGVTFSLGGGGVTSGSPTITFDTSGTGTKGLDNSTTVLNPTADWLVADFDSPVDNVSFYFDNQGNNSWFPGGGTSYTAYYNGGTSSLSGSLANVRLATISLASLSGITRIVWDNGASAYPYNTWLFTVGKLSFNQVSVVPLPPAVLMFAPALLGFMGLRRKSKLAATA